MFKMLNFRRPSDSQYVKGSKTPLKSARQYIYPIVSSLWVKLSFRTSLLVISEIWGLFVNKLTADDKHSFHNRENLLKPIQMELSKKPENLSEFFAAYLECT